MSQIEERLARLEQVRYNQLAQVNVLRTMLISAWGLLCNQQENPTAAYEHVVANWLRGAEESAKDLRPLDAAEIALVSDLYRKAMVATCNELRLTIRPAK